MAGWQEGLHTLRASTVFIWGISSRLLGSSSFKVSGLMAGISFSGASLGGHARLAGGDPGRGAPGHPTPPHPPSPPPPPRPSSHPLAPSSVAAARFCPAVSAPTNGHDR